MSVLDLSELPTESEYKTHQERYLDQFARSGKLPRPINIEHELDLEKFGPEQSPDTMLSKASIPNAIKLVAILAAVFGLIGLFR